MSPKEKYISFCNENPNEVSLFIQPWWLDILSGKNDWDVVLSEKNGIVNAALPYIVRKIPFIKYIHSAPLSPAVGIYLRDNTVNEYATRLRLQRKHLKELVVLLPKFDSCLFRIENKVLDWRPFYWKGFKQSTYYSSRIESSVPYESIKKGYRKNVRADIKHASERLIIEESNKPEDYFHLIQSSYERKGDRMSFSKELFYKIFEASQTHSCALKYVAKDREGNNSSSIFCIIDDNLVYYIFGGINSDQNIRGAQALLIDHCIKWAIEHGKAFDFEGSMIQSIDHFFMAFSPKLQPYHHLSLNKSLILKLKKSILG